ncbi:MAG: hypothetical protein PHW79_02375 [Candidatus Marinimicrobia bacterium]|nr:hypothetical protein [Candidatus Neomarinimicrobiota bacterium]
MIRSHRRLKQFFLTLVALPALVLAIGLDVPATDPVYDFLKRLETRGIVRGLNDMALPFTRDEVVALLQKAATKESELSSIEKSILREFLADYRYETKRHVSSLDSIDAPIYQKRYFWKFPGKLFSRENGVEENHLLMYENGDNFFWFDVGARARVDWKDNHQKQMVSDRYLFRGALGKSLTFHTFFARIAKKYNPSFTEPYDEEIGNWSMFQPDSVVSLDVLQSSLVYHNDRFDLGLFRQPISWGASGTNNLILSKNVPMFSYIGFNTRFKGVKLTFLNGSLMNDSTQFRGLSIEERNRSKYIAAHRLDIPLFHGTTAIGFSEMVIYGDREIELSYVMPFGFFWAAGHSLEDRDNMLMAMDFKTTFLKNVTFYGSALIDEMRFGELGNHWWANKHALQAGARFSPTIASIPIDFQAEFTAVRPWTYTHKTLTTDYTQNGICLGFPYGANSQAWFFQIGASFTRRLSVSGQFLHLKQGIDDATHFWGGNPTVSYELRDTTYDHSTKWLMGDIQITNLMKIVCNYELFNDFYIKTGAEFNAVELNDERESHRFGYIELEVNF